MAAIVAAFVLGVLAALLGGVPPGPRAFILGVLAALLGG